MKNKNLSTGSTPAKNHASRTVKKTREEAVIDVSPFQEDVRAQAYYNFLKRLQNNAPGSAEGDWFEAEKIIRHKSGGR